MDRHVGEPDPEFELGWGLPPVTPEEKAAWLALLKWRVDEYNPEIHPSPIWSDAPDEMFDREWLAFAVGQLDQEHADVFRLSVDDL